jgi:hypothetical protein
MRFTHVPVSRVRHAALAAAAGVLLMNGCGDGPTGVTCTPHAPFPAAAVAHLTPATLAAAIADASSRSVPVVFGAGVPAMQATLGDVRAGLASRSTAACRAVRTMRDRLNEVADVEATRSDRAALTLVLDLTESFLAH